MKNLFGTVCVVESQGRSGAARGQGVFVKSNVVVTAAHILKDSMFTRCTNLAGNEARAITTSRYNRINLDLDLISFEIREPLATQVAHASADFNSLTVDGGHLIHRFNGNPKACDIHVSQKHLAMDLLESGGSNLTFRTEHAVSEGYSGAPVFNKKGELVSLLCSGEHDNFIDAFERKPTKFFNGPSPHELANFILRTIG